MKVNIFVPCSRFMGKPIPQNGHRLCTDWAGLVIVIYHSGTLSHFVARTKGKELFWSERRHILILLGENKPLTELKMLKG